MKEKKALVKMVNVWKIYKMGEFEVPALRNVSLDNQQW